MYSVIWSEDAWNDFEKMILNQRSFEEVFKLINDLKVDPFEESHGAPNGDNEYYRSTGKHRVLYQVSNGECIILAIRWKDRVY